MSSIILGVDHPAIAVADADGYAEWCCRVLGYRRVVRHERPAWLLQGPDGTYLEVMAQDNTPRPQRTTWTPGWSHLALRVADLDRAAAELEAKGMQFLGAAVEAVGGGRVRSFADPEGNLWQIVERPMPSARS